MATKQIAAYNTNSVVGATINEADAALLVQALFVGLNGSGKIVPADFRASAGAYVCRGALLENAQQKDPKGNVLGLIPGLRGTYTFEGRIANLSGLTPGATYYLLSGGGYTATKPAATTGDVDQEVGYALSATELVIQIGPAVIHA